MNKYFKYYLFLGIIFFKGLGISQNETSKWYFGNQAGLDFMTNPPTILTNGAIISPEGCASIASSTGGLLFYTNGTTIWDRTHSMMANGSGLMGHPSTSQSAVIVKKPGSSSIYYVFTLTTFFGTLYYHEVDMSLNGGLGFVTNLNTVLTSSLTEHMTSVKHCNGIDTWVVVHGNGNPNANAFYAFLVTSAGVSNTPVRSVSGSSLTPGLQAGCMKFSPNGTKLGLAVYVNTLVEVFDFNASSGIVSNPTALSGGIASPYGVEFSPDGTKFYCKGSSFIGQWNLCAGSATAIVASLTTFTSAAGIGALQLASNGKIYVAKYGQSFLGVINNPNLAGSACNYVDAGQSVAPNLCQGGLPSFINSEFRMQTPFSHTVSSIFGCQTASFTAPSIAQSIGTAGCAASGYSLTSLQWNFGDPSSGAANTSNQTNPSHGFAVLGTYTVQLVLRFSCGGGTDTIRQSVNITQPCISVTSNSITCASLGSATVSSLLGIGPFSYTWMPSMQTGSVATGLSPGTHTVTVFDSGNNFTYTAQTVFTSLIPLTGTLNATNNLFCRSATNGTANVTNFSGGSGSENYLWTNGITTYTSAFVNSLSAGSWSVTVTDALTACQMFSVFTITEPPSFTLTLSSGTPSVCLGGEIVLTGTNSGGTPGYTYTWTSGPGINTYTVNETTAGTYVYTLQSLDANSCAISTTISVDFIPNPTLSVSSISICPLETGTLNVSGAASYTWWSSASFSLTGNIFMDNPAISKQYTVVGSSQSCTNMATANIILKPVPTVVFNTNSPRCEGSSLFLNSTAGASYSWSGPNGFNSILRNNSINPLTLNDAGVYSLTVTAANNCTASSTKTIVVNPIPTLSVNGATVCSSQTLNLIANSNASSFLWTGSQSFTSTNQNPFIVNPVISNSGTYTVKATSAQGCTNTAQALVSVIAPPSLTTALSSNGTLCAQALNGSPNTITLTSSGAGSYTLFTPHHISNPNPGGPISPISSAPPYNAGISTATLQGSNGVCLSTTTITFNVIPNPSLTISSPTPVICAGQSYTYTNQGASSYTWGPGSPNLTTYTGPSTIASPTVTSVYSVVGGSLGCNSSTQTSTITVNPLPTITIVPVSPTVCVGSIVSLAANGNATSYSWSPYNGLVSTTGVTVNASPTVQQNYTVTGALNSCTNTAMVTVSVLTLPKPIATALNPKACLNETITLQGSGGEFYNWNSPNGHSYTGQTISFKAEDIYFDGDYTLTVSDKNDCKASTTTNVEIYELPGGTLLGSIMKHCVPFRSEFSYFSASSTASNISTQWYLKDKVFPSKNFFYDFIVPGNYTITGNYEDVITHCVNTKTFIVEAYPVPVADFSFLPEKPIENLDEVIFTNTSKGDEQKKWNWYFVNNQGYTSQNKSTSYLFTEAGVYPIAMVVTNTWGCKDTLVKILKVESDLTVYVPNVFTPNGDELNDIFIPVTRAVKFYELNIYDRWGAKVFSTKETQMGWDGAFKGEPCKSDVYIWKINLSSVNGEMKTLTGHVTLSR